MFKFVFLAFAALVVQNASSQTVYLTSSGGSFTTEKWMSITTGINGSGTQVWGQGNGTYGNGQGLLADQTIDLSAYCGQTLYINAYDRYDDSWDGTTYTLYDAAGQTGNLLASNGGVSPDSGDDNDCNGSGWCTTDPASELEASEAFIVPACPCTFPAGTFTVLPDCGNAQFSIQVNVTSLGDAASVDISDGTTIFQTSVSTGTYTVGPFAAGVNKTISIEGTTYGGCDINSAALTESCVCSNPPIATTNAVNLDCINLDFDIEATVTNYGDGSAADIWIDGSLVQSNAVLNNTYTFTGYVTGTHAIDIRASGGAFVSCETSYSETAVCTPDICTDAIDILGASTTADLSVANNDSGETDGVGEPNTISMGNGTTMSNCGSGPQHSAYYYTDYTDLWYKIDIPNGSDQFSLTFTGLTCPVAVLPYTGSCGSLSLMNIGTSFAGGIVDADFDANVDNENGDEPFISTDGTIHFRGADVISASTGTIYLRIIPHDDQASGTNCNPADISYCSFDLIATSPQPNDICSDAIDIVDPTTFLPLTATGDISQSNIDADTHDEVNGESCNGINFATSEEDLWYSVETPATGNYYLNVDINYTGAVGPMYVLLHNYCAAGDTDPIGCMSISSSGTVVFDQTNITNFDNALTSGNEYKIRIVKPTGSLATSFDITGNLVAENNSCAIMQQTFPGFDLDAGPQTANFNFASGSGAVPTQADNDLWYQFDPVAGSDNGNSVYSSSVDLQVGGLTAGQELTVMIYKRSGASSCNSLASDFIYEQTITSNGTAVLNCLDELHGTSATGDGYILRVIQTAGSTADNVFLQAFPNPVGPFNNDCENIWDGSGPAIVGGGNASNYFNPWFIPAGTTNYVVDDFENATDCHPNITSSDCGGIDLTHGRDLWFVFEVPASTCGSAGLSSSSVINSMDITYNAGNAFRDGRMFVYDGCSDADLIDCSPSLDGAGETWTVTGLTQGQFYLLRVKPSSLNSDDEYSIDITVEEGTPRPCNDDAASAESMPVNSCNDYDNLPTWSMQGASESSGAGVPESEVWFTFVAPSPANGGPYFNANKSWVTVFFENITGTSTGPLSLQLYNSPTSIVATSNTFSTGTAAGSQGFAQFGHLNPGQTYYLRLYSKENETTPVEYSLNVYTPDANTTPWECGMNSQSLTSGCSEGCNDLREAYFKIDLPVGTPSNKYYMIEVVGEDQILDFELRSQYLTESSATEGDIDDYDLPCSSRPLEPAVSMVSEVLGVTVPTTGESCNLNGDPTDGGSGVRRVYFGMNGPAAGMKDYYYVKVFMDPSDPNYASTTGLKICTINFNGPYSSQALAESGGPIDEICTSTPLAVELVSFDGKAMGELNVLTWETASEIENSHFEVEHSSNGIVFTPIGSVDGNGTTTELQAYSFNHRVDKKLNYYRLKQFDFDGTATSSDVIVIESKNAGVQLYPNPSKTGSQIVVSSEERISTITVSKLDGTTILKKLGVAKKTVILEEIYNPGVYVVVVSTSIGSETLKLVIQ
ncbi:MAG: T9SS type A sorting domain-containing protein [Crocinitomicaceae bacterium]|nr:T9SS type A sorting domain-containing protein [Crocinitomicaceae bacterium]